MCSGMKVFQIRIYLPWTSLCSSEAGSQAEGHNPGTLLQARLGSKRHEEEQQHFLRGRKCVHGDPNPNLNLIPLIQPKP